MKKILIAFTAIFVLFGTTAVYAAAAEKKDVTGSFFRHKELGL